MAGLLSESISRSQVERVPRRPRSGHLYGRRAWVFGTINICLFFVLWQIVAGAQIVSPLFLPTVSGIIESFHENSVNGLLPHATLWSLQAFVIGMAISCALGIPIGLLMGANRLVYTILSPYVWAFQALPRVAFIPMIILFLGFGLKAELMLIVISAVFPIIVNCLAGVQTVDSSLIKAGQVFGAGKLQIYRHVILPFTLPFIVSGVNQGMSRALVAVVVAEFFAGGNGLGNVIKRAGDEFDAARLYAALIVLVVVALLFVQLTRWLELRAGRWRGQGNI